MHWYNCEEIATGYALAMTIETGIAAQPAVARNDREEHTLVKCGEGLQICAEHGRFAAATLLAVNEQGECR